MIRARLERLEQRAATRGPSEAERARVAEMIRAALRDGACRTISSLVALAEDYGLTAPFSSMLAIRVFMETPPEEIASLAAPTELERAAARLDGWVKD